MEQSLNYFRKFNLDKLFFFVLFIFAAKSTVEFSTFGLTTAPINFILVAALSLCVCIKHNSKILSNKFIAVVAIFILWKFILKYGSGIDMKLTYLIHLIFTIWVCFVAVNSLKDKIFIYFEQLVTTLTFICIFLYIINVILGPNVLMPLCFFTPYGGSAEGSMLIYNISSHARDYEGGTLFGLLRNHGFAWEAGRFASFIIIAIVLNLSRTKFKIVGNKALHILIFGLLTTFSTTGYAALIIVFLCFGMTQFRGVGKFVAVLTIIISALYIVNLPFMRDKIESNADQETFITNDVEHLRGAEKYRQEQSDVVVFTPQRFECIALDYMNFHEYPLTGYGMDKTQSFVHRNISEYVALANGIFKEFAHWGIVIGLLFNIMLIKSSRNISPLLNRRNTKWILAITYYIISISYSFLLEPGVMVLFLFTLFANYNYEKDFNYYNKLQ